MVDQAWWEEAEIQGPLIDAELSELVHTPVVLDRRNWFLKNYVAVRKLGKGAEGLVFEAMKKPHGTAYAVKGIVQTYQDNGEPIAHNEVRMLKLLSNVGVGRGRENICLPGMEAFWFPSTPDTNTQVLVMENCALGSLGDHVSGLSEVCTAEWEGAAPPWVPLHEGLLRHIYVQIMAGLAFLHTGLGTTAFCKQTRTVVGRRAIVHRDIKPTNLLVCPAPPDAAHPSLVTVKIADFGGAAEYPDSPDRPSGLVFFTRGYIAPEFCDKRASRRRLAGPATDIYAAGATMHWCVFGTTPAVTLDPQSGRVVSFGHRGVRGRRHAGGRFSGDFANRVAEAITTARHRPDALAILERLRKASGPHRRAYLEWVADTEAEEQDDEQPELAEGGLPPAQSSSKAGKRDRLAQAARLQCYSEACAEPKWLPHTHACFEADCAGTWGGHWHELRELEGTWLDPRVHLQPLEYDQVSLIQLEEVLYYIRMNAKQLFEDSL